MSPRAPTAAHRGLQSPANCGPRAPTAAHRGLQAPANCGPSAPAPGDGDGLGGVLGVCARSACLARRGPGRPLLDDRAVQAEVPGRLLLDPRASPAAVPVRLLLAHRALRTESRGVHRSTNVQCPLRSAVPGRRSACIARCGPRAPLLGNRAMQTAVPGRLLLGPRASPAAVPGRPLLDVQCKLRSQGVCCSIRVHRRLRFQGAHCSTNVRCKLSFRAPTARQTCTAN